MSEDIDLYFIGKAKLSLRTALKLYDRKYGTLKANLLHVYKSLAYFDEAEGQEMPVMLKAFRWDELKTYFKREVSTLV